MCKNEEAYMCYPVYSDAFSSCIGAKDGKELMWVAGELTEKQHKLQVNHEKLFKAMALFCAQRNPVLCVSMLSLCFSASR